MANKRPAEDSGPAPASKKDRKSITLEKKLEVLARYDRGESTANIKHSMQMSESTLRTIRNNAEKIKKSVKAGVHLSASKSSYARSDIMERMEKMLSTWITIKNRETTKVSYNVAREKASEIYEHLKSQTEGEVKPFAASPGWYNNFIRRCGFHNIKARGEIASADMETAERYPSELKAVIEEGEYTAKQIINMDETAMYWKKMPDRTYISVEEKSAPGCKVAKDRYTLMFGANVEGDLKLKPLMIYHWENPRALKGYYKQLLPVHWYSNKKGWMTGSIFKDYFLTHLPKELEVYCKSQDIPFKILLLLDNAPAHPPSICGLHPNIKVVFLPPNTTSVIQPMDQGVIQMFKSHYLKNTFKDLSQKTDISMAELEKAADAPDLSAVNVKKNIVKEYWKNFNIKHSIWFVKDAWAEVTQSCLNGAWKKLCPHLTNSFEGFNLNERISKRKLECVQLAQRVGFTDVGEEDVDALLASHTEELTAEDLDDLEAQRQQEKEEEAAAAASSQGRPMKSLTIKDLSSFFSLLENALDIMDSKDPNVERSGLVYRRVMQDVGCNKELLQEKRRVAQQSTLHAYFSPTKTSESDDPQPSTSTGRGRAAVPPPASDPDDPQPSTSGSGRRRSAVPPP